MLCLQADGVSGYAPDSAVTFFCFAKRKSPKKRRADVRAASRFLALLAPLGVWLNSLRSDNASPYPSAAPLLSPASTAGKSSIRKPLQRMRCGLSPARIEQRSVPAQPGDESGSPSLCLLSLGEARESESPVGARPDLHAN